MKHNVICFTDESITVQDAIKSLQMAIDGHETRTAIYNLAIQALQEKQERENPQALTVEELREMDGEPVWVKSGDRVFACVVQKRPGCNNNVFAHGFHDYNSVRLVHDVTFTFSAMDVECYRYPPKEEKQ